MQIFSYLSREKSHFSCIYQKKVVLLRAKYAGESPETKKELYDND